MMRLAENVKTWWRRRRLKRAGQEPGKPLREFVYLDEVSVYSLLASRLGPIATDFSETEKSSLQAEYGGTVGLGVGVAKGETRGSELEIRGRESQVVRKSIIQTKFKELYELEAPSFAIRCVEALQEPPFVQCIADLSSTSTSTPWVIDPGALSRGQLFEVEAELETDAIFQVNAVVSAILFMLQDSPELVRSQDLAGLAEAGSVNRVLEKLLVGLVPIRGRLVDYKTVTLKGRERLVHRRLLDVIDNDEELSTHPVYVVGVAEQGLFWKDIRRVIFSKSRYRVMCRLSKPGLQNSWTPVKLAQVLGAVIPDFERQMNTALHTAVERIRQSGSGETIKDQRFERMKKTLLAYGRATASRHGGDIPKVDERLLEMVDRHRFAVETVDERRRAFKAVDEMLSQECGIKSDPDEAVQRRWSAQLEGGLLDDSSQLTAPSPTVHEAHDDRFLDSEFVALYW